MDDKSVKERRKDIRIELLSEHMKINGKLVEVKNISQSGLFFVDALESFRIADMIYIELSLPGDLGYVALDGKIVHARWADKDPAKRGFGVKFDNVPVNIQKIVDAYCVYLRNKQIITVSKRIIEEFFGPKTPQF
jgi:hypothetical protein